MKKQAFWFTMAFTGSVLFSLNTAVQAQASCDTCSQLTQLNAYAEDTNTYTVATNTTLNTLLERVTLALFGALPALGNGSVAAAFSVVPTVQSNGYAEQQALLHTLETAYQGNADKDSTLINNYSIIFGDYLLQNANSATSFNTANASIAALYLDPSKPGFYSEAQQAQAETYIKLVSGTALSQLRKPSSDWLTVHSGKEDPDRAFIRNQVSNYYTYSALQSAITDNFTYIYGLNKGKKITGSLDDYTESSISESGLFTYIQTQKPENPDWYKQIGGMGVVGLMREQTILMGGCFLMLSRIEEDIRRLLVTNSAQASLLLIAAQSISQSMSQSTAQKPLPTNLIK